MKAAVLTALRRIEWRDLPDPVLRQPTEVLLRVDRVGVCGSDLHYYADGRIGPRQVEYPFVMGHECAGTVLETGAAVRRVRPGQLVAVDPAHACGQCDQCLAGRPHTCRQLTFLGCPGEAAGCLSQYLVIGEDCLYPAGPGVTADQAALAEPLSIGYYAVRQSTVSWGAAIGILGAGPIGLSVLQAALDRGVGPTYVTDPLAYRAEVARQAGATWTGDPSRPEVVREILERQPLGLEVVFECAGQQAALDQAADLLKPGGMLMLIGIPREERVSFPIDLLRRKEITLVNVRRQNGCVAPALELIASGAVRLDFLLTHRYPLAQTAEAFETVAHYRDGVLKAMIEP